ncbi:MAG: hypothetical protein WBC45_03670 [Atribacterota bacterium]
MGKIEKENKEFKNKRIKISYYIIIFVFICIGTLFYFLGPKLGWFLTPSYTALRTTNASEVNIESDIPNYPLEFISDGYKFVRITATKNVNWVWQHTVLNKSEKKCKITVTFKLIDDDDFVISSSVGYGEAMADSTITIRGEGSIPVCDLKRAFNRAWEISYEKSYSSGFIPEGY